MVYYTHKAKEESKMPIEEDRHIGTRENIWFPWEEHRKMLDAMAAIKETNKSNFIRSAVRYLIETINKETANA